MGQERRKLSDEYEVTDILGRGGFSVVRKGVRKANDNGEERTFVAIKTLKRFASTPRSMTFSSWKQEVSVSDALLTNEILVMKKIVDSVSPHPNVINLYDVYEDQSGVHLVLELCSGGELFDRIVKQEKYYEVGAAAVGEVNFDERSWKNITSSAKHLIKSLLTVDPDKRPSAQEILTHPWVIGDSAKEEQMDAEIVSRLQSFNARRKFRVAAMASVLSSTVLLRTKKLKKLLGSHDLTEKEIENLRLHFTKICAKGDNATLVEFAEVLRAMNMSSLIPLAPRIFDLFDNNRDGTVDLREVLCGFSSLRSSKGDDALRLCFQMYDTDRSGCITKEEVASMLRALPDDCLPPNITEPGKLDEIFDLMDANSDGKVTFEEFKAAMQRDSSLQDYVLSSLRQQ
ncbi:calcium and calcium/calmodulin-dependent serine/threonine-protein kinase-like [Tripterygium wilfordii]|uniref:Calcium and calcium/calmodulin-dependent serine/threonine-protein kinase-like n=1 Tax=Tripterygium wilfordii TaxID=458696 RepID=A0A7J7C5Z7_TRIWF|nr:calcium and calcium/calmodulin-dependent serine/threonine-protein kinase-like [Tripterygium wilfordii]